MKNDIAKKIAAAILKEKRDRWTAMSDKQRHAVFGLQARINIVALSYIEGNAKCVSCGAEAYKADKVATGLASVTACADCGSYKFERRGPVELVRCCCGRSLESGVIHFCPHERQPTVAQTCVPCKSRRN